MERKLKRKDIAKKKKNAEKEMATKVALFGKLPDKCLTCEKPFDKTNKEMVKSWNEVVREEEEVVRLYCPDCWQKAQDIIKGFKQHIQNKKKGKNE